MVMSEKRIEDYWNVDGEELSDAWTGSTRFILLNEKPPEGYTLSGGIDEKTNDFKTRQCVARHVETHV